VVPPALAEEAGDKMAEVFKKEIKPAEDLLPVGVTVAKEFKTGEGDPVGKIKKISGKVLVVHKNGTEAYPLSKGADLFVGDMIITDAGASVQAALNDKSTVSLSGYTKLVIDKSTYDPKAAKKRDSLLNLIFGKARFIVSKVAEGKEDYMVKTPTAISGVRGSDFALSVAPTDKVAAAGESPLVTTVATGKNTTVSFKGDVGPTQIVGPNMISKAVAGMAATVPLALTAAVAVTALGGAGAAAAGMSTAAIVGIGAAVAAAGGVAAASSSDSDDTPPPPAVPVPQPPEPPEPPAGGTPCNELTTSGGDEPETRTVELGQTSGTFDFFYEMYSQKDQMVVSYEGMTLFDTGCVSGSATNQISYAGSTSQVTVEVVPNCEGGSGTAWDFTVSCPK
jgi:hypothetical protein